MRLNTKPTLLAVALIGTATLTTLAAAQHAGHGTPQAPPPGGGVKPPAPISMEELHKNGGVPRGWKFTLPAGNPAAGREAFSKFECNKCHEIKPDFPRGERGPGDVGPELTGMGGHHPAEYFAQSIIDPNAVIIAGPGYIGPDGRSIMPDYRDSLTFTELVDLVAYLKSTGGGAHHHHHDAASVKEQAAGPYRIRVAYHDPSADHAHHHGGGPGAKQAGHLMVFVADAETGEPVPYLPVSALITAAKTPPRTVRLAPMLGASGFHYGADVTLPEGTTKVTLNVGAPGLKTMGGAAKRFGKPVTVGFDWSD